MSQEELHRLAEDFVARLRRGESVRWEDVAAAHAHLREEIARIFPVLAAVESVKGPVLHEVEPVEPGLPATIGSWRILRTLGRGGMGTVYDGRAPDGRRAAVKVIHAHLVSHSGYRARFLHEREAQRRVAHPNVVALLESGTVLQDGLETPFVVMEYVAGQTLRALIDEVGPMPERLVRHIGASMADALEACHAAGVVHRDIKPDNVAITEDETVKLMDFGVALSSDQLQRLSGTGDFVGSLLYASPEQLRGRDVDLRADLYGLGVVLFELLTGEHPAEDRHSIAGVARGLSEAVRSPARRVRGVSRVLDALVWQLLAPDPADRPASAALVADVLRRGSASAWWAAHDARRSADPLAWQPRMRHEFPLIGRTRELDALHDALADVRRGSGRVVLVDGPGGIGKTRLLDAWLEDVSDDPHPPVVLCAEHPPDGTLSASPLADALRARLDPDELDARIADRLAGHGTLARVLVAHLRGHDARRANEPLFAESVATAYMRFLAALAKERPVIVLMEDLQFASTEGRSQFQALAHGASVHPLLVIGSQRPGPSTQWTRTLDDAAHVRRIPLAGLAPDDARALLIAASGGRGSAAAPDEERLAASAGHPLLLMASARGSEAPVDLGAVVDARVAQLEPRLRDLLAVAACHGYRFDAGVCARVLRLPRLRVLRDLLTLEREHDLVRAETSTYRFRHHLVHEMLYRELSPSLRAAWHAALGHALASDEHDAGRAGPRAAELCRHFLLAQRVDLARAHLVVALRHLLETERAADATRMAREALEEPALLAPEAQAWARFVLGRFGLDARPLHECLAELKAAEAQAQAAGDGALGAQIAHAISSCLHRMVRLDEALAYGERDVALSALYGTPEQEIRAMVSLAVTQWRAGQRVEPPAMCERAAERARAHGLFGAQASALSALGQFETDAGDIAAATGHLRRAVALFDRCGLRRDALGTTSALGVAYYQGGDMLRAGEVIEEVVQRAREVGDLHSLLVARANHARTLILLGRFEEAIEQVADAEEALGDRDWGLERGHLAMTRASALESLGRPIEADAAGAPAVQLGRARKDVLLLVSALCFRARSLVWRGHADQAMDAWAEGLAFAQARGHRESLLGLLGQRCELLDVAGDVQALPDAVKAFGDAMAGDGRGRLSLELHVWTARAALQQQQPRVALDALNAADAIARKRNLEGVRAALRVERCWLPEGDALQARAALEQHGNLLPWRRHVVAWARLADATEHARDRAQAVALCESFLAQLSDEEREHARAHVPLFRRWV